MIFSESIYTLVDRIFTGALTISMNQSSKFLLHAVRNLQQESVHPYLAKLHVFKTFNSNRPREKDHSKSFLCLMFAETLLNSSYRQLGASNNCLLGVRISSIACTYNVYSANLISLFRKT